jgi:tRNA uridine 5-carbamoylmethylation protein Kti12
MNTKEKMFNEVYINYKNKLSNLDSTNSPLLICFAGVPGSGITTISKRLEEELKGVRINSDDVQNILQVYRGKEFYEGFILEKREFIYWLIREIISEYGNKLVILDKSIDRSYEDIKKLAKELDIPFVVISLETSRKELVKRLNNLYGEYAKNYINDLDGWIKGHEEFKKKYRYDMLFDTEVKDPKEVAEETGNSIILYDVLKQ